MRTIFVTALLLILAPAVPASAECWAYCARTDSWRLDPVLDCGYGDAVSKCYDSAPAAPVADVRVVYESDERVYYVRHRRPVHRERAIRHRRYYPPPYRTRHYETHRAYWRRHPKTAEVRRAHHRYIRRR